MSISRVSNSLLAFVAAVLVVYLLGTACSSGGGGNNVNRPMVNETVPADTTTDVFLNTIVTTIFDDNMDPATITTTTFTVEETVGGSPVTGTVSYHPPTRSATFIPAAPLASNLEYTGTITTGATNTLGNTLAANFTWTFTTGVNTDATAPTVVTTVPADTDTDVLVGDPITAEFSEQMNIATISGTTFTVMGGSPVAGTVAFNSTTLVATFTPSAPLQDSTHYTATITTGVEDQAQNQLAAPFVWTFTTADNTPPSVVSGVPSNNATDVALNATFSATFSEDMNPATLTLDAASVSINFNTVAFPGVVAYDAPSRTVTFTPDNNLAASTTYRFYVGTNAEDLAGNSLPLYTALFTTINDAVAPTVTDQFPADTDDGAVNTVVTATFSEPVDPSTIVDPAGTFTVNDGTVDVTGTVTYDVFSRTATFTPAAPLTIAVDHTATLTSGIQDLAGNALTGAGLSLTWTFTTIAADATAPSVLTWTPDDSDADVSVATHQVIEFDEPMDRPSVQAALVVTSSVSGAPINPSQLFWNDAGDTVTVVFDTTSPAGIEADDLLDEDADYTIDIAGATDLAGNALGGTTDITWDTQDDVTDPTVESTVPDFATAQAAGSTPTIVITFDEDMDTSFADVFMSSESDIDDRVASVGADDPDGDLTVTWTPPRELTLDFNEPTTGQFLQSNTAYEIEIRVADLAGNRFDGDSLFIVTTGADAGNPSVISNVPASSATGVNPNSLALVNFSRTMAPDIFDHISVSGNGATLYDFERMVDPPGVLIMPRQAWPGSSTITVSVDALATDASGNTLIGAHSFSFTTTAQTTNSWTLDADYNERKDGDTAVQTSRFDEELFFQDSAGRRVFINPQTLASRDVTLREADTGIPVKGFRVESVEDGQLVLWTPGTIATGLQTDTDYELVFNSSLRNTHGIGITPTTLSFTTTDGADTAPNVDDSPGAEMFVFWNPSPPPVGFRAIDLRVNVSDDDGDDPTVDAQGVQAPAFAAALTEFAPGMFEYSSITDETTLVNGLNSIEFTIDDIVNTFTFRRDVWNFGSNGVPVPTGPVGGIEVSGGVPTYTFSFPSSTRNNADILFLMVSEVVGIDEIPALFVVLPTNATSFTQPFDTPLPVGEYVMCVGAATFASGTARGEFNGFVIGATGLTPDFTVVPPGSATSGAKSQKAATPGRPSLGAWR